MHGRLPVSLAHASELAESLFCVVCYNGARRGGGSDFLRLPRKSTSRLMPDVGAAAFLMTFRAPHPPYLQNTSKILPSGKTHNNFFVDNE